jgi:peptide/nickel transport system permease protein
MTAHAAAASPDAERSRAREVLGRARRLPANLLFGAAVLVLYGIVAVTGPWWVPHDIYETGLTPFAGSSGQHWFGTDILGRDVFSRVVVGTREVLFLALSSVAISTVLGGTIGLFCGYVGGLLDAVVMRVLEILISIPFLVLVLLIVAAVGPKGAGSYLLLIGVVVIVYAPRTARVARSVAIDLSTRDFVTVARARGETAWSVARREIAPSATGPLLVEFGVRAGAAPILISTLGFLGFGARPPSPEWGLMIAENRAALGSQPVTVLAPIVALSVLVIALNLFTDGLARLLGRTATRGT